MEFSYFEPVLDFSKQCDEIRTNAITLYDDSVQENVRRKCMMFEVKRRELERMLMKRLEEIRSKYLDVSAKKAYRVSKFTF